MTRYTAIMTCLTTLALTAGCADTIDAPLGADVEPGDSWVVDEAMPEEVTAPPELAPPSVAEPEPEPRPGRPTPTDCVTDVVALDEIIDERFERDPWRFRVDAQLCDPEDVTWAVIRPSRYVHLWRLGTRVTSPLQIRIHGRDRDTGELEPLTNLMDQEVLTFDTFERVHGLWSVWDKDALFLEIRSDTPRAVELEVGPYLDSSPFEDTVEPVCPGGGSYEYLGDEETRVEIPGRVEKVLCHARDTVVWSAELGAGRPVTVTLTNPESILDFSLWVVGMEPRPDEEAFETPRIHMGLAAHHTYTFTPERDGLYGFVGQSGISRGEPMQIHVTQQ